MTREVQPTPSADRTAARSRRPRADLVLAVLFCTLLGLPLLDSALSIDPLPPPPERRQLAPLPSLSRSGPTRFPRHFTSYWMDHFGLRNSLIRLRSRLLYSGLGVSPHPNVVPGSDGWLFFIGERMDRVYDGEELPEEVLLNWRRWLRSHMRWLDAHEARFLFVVTPEKQSIYPERAGALAPNPAASTSTDQILRYVEARSDVPVLDLRGPLQEARRREQIYFTTDTHWNYLGGHHAYRLIASRLRQWFPEIPVHPRSDYRQVPRQHRGDLSAMMALEDRIPEPVVFLQPRFAPCARPAPGPTTGFHSDVRADMVPRSFECDDPTLPRAVLFVDSFGNRITPLLAECFSRSTFLRYSTQQWNRHLLLEEKPDVVILQVAERYLTTPPQETFGRTRRRNRGL